MNRPEWEVVLRLAVLWGFDGLKDASKGELVKLIMNPTEKYELGTCYGAKSLIDAAVVALAVRKEIVIPSEAARIGYDVAYMLQLCLDAGNRKQEDSTLPTRMRTAISNVFGLDSAFIDEVTEYKALCEEMRTVRKKDLPGSNALRVAQELGIAVYRREFSPSQLTLDLRFHLAYSACPVKYVAGD